METWYKTSRFDWKIETAAVLSVTATSLLVEQVDAMGETTSTCVKRSSKWAHYHPTSKEALDSLRTRIILKRAKLAEEEKEFNTTLNIWSTHV